MNEAFKIHAKVQGVKFYEIAEVLGIRPQEFSVQYMRHELTPAEDQKLRSIVNEIAKRGKQR